MIKKFGDFIIKYHFDPKFHNFVKMDFFIDDRNLEFLKFLASLEGIYSSFDKNIDLNFHVYSTKDPKYKE